MYARRIHPLRRTFSTSTKQVIVGLRREDPARIWERRAPLSPTLVGQLVRDGVLLNTSQGQQQGEKVDVKVVVQSCSRRIWTDSAYEREGAKVVPSLKDEGCHITIGIKETPLDELYLDRVDGEPRTHFMFSHTVKGQSYNTPLLSRFLTVPSSFSRGLESDARLVDYELLTDSRTGKRTVGFGWYAGVAGVLESLSSMAHAHLEKGVASPFLYTPRPHTMPSLDALREGLRGVGRMIAEEGTGRLGPVVIGLTGTGNVAQGCLSMLSELPVEFVRVEDLFDLVVNPDTPLNKIYVVHAKPEDYLVRSDGAKYDREDYYRSPHLWTSEFGTKVYPYLTLLLNGTGWSPSFPRLMTNAQLAHSLSLVRNLSIFNSSSNPTTSMRGENVGDISCDVHGGLEFLTRSTTLSEPYYTSAPDEVKKEGGGVRMMAVDILPASIPRDASVAFGEGVMPYLKRAVGWYAGQTREEGEIAEALERATVASGGLLKEDHRWLEKAVVDWRNGQASSPSSETVQSSSAPSVNRKKNVLLLGSGMVAGPTVDMVAGRSDVRLVIGTNSASEAQRLTRKHPHVEYKIVDVNDPSSFGGLVEQADVVISLLPVPFHPRIAESCIQHRKHLVTASYISPAMKALHDRAVQADVLLLNEIGLDPGVDHCSAISLVEKIKSKGDRVASFTSFCGGLPAPEAVDGPLKYKFSWSPRGVLTAALNGARFKLQNSVHQIEPENLLKTVFRKMPLVGEFELEGLANRDSLPYAQAYGLGKLDDVRTCFRGTLRYPGFSNLMYHFKSLGLLVSDRKIELKSWQSLVQDSLACLTNEKEGRVVASAVEAVTAVVRDRDAAEEVLLALEWFGLLPVQLGGIQLPRGEASGMPPLPTNAETPLDLFSILLAHKLKYGKDERDMVVLSHETISQSSVVGKGEQVHRSTLIAYGDEEHSAMARTVGMPVAFAALRIIDGGVVGRGVMGPTESSVYECVLEGMERNGLGMKETVVAKDKVASEDAERYAWKSEFETVEDSLGHSLSSL